MTGLDKAVSGLLMVAEKLQQFSAVPEEGCVCIVVKTGLPDPGFDIERRIIPGQIHTVSTNIFVMAETGKVEQRCDGGARFVD